MFQKKTSRRRSSESKERMLELRVSSPRIMMFEWLRFGGQMLKYGIIFILVAGTAFLAKAGWEKLFVENVEEFGLLKLPLTNFEDEPTTFLTATRVHEASGVIVGSQKTIFQFEPDEVEAQLVALPEIAEAKVTRRLPDSLEIKVKERVPVAWIACPSLGLEEKNPEKGLLLDQEGVPFRCAAPTILVYARELPVIYSGELPTNSVIEGKKVEHEGVSEALNLITGLSETLGDYDQPAYVIVKDEITLEARTRRGTRATFSYFDQERQLENFLKLIHHARDTGQQIKTINLIPYRLVPVEYQ